MLTDLLPVEIFGYGLVFARIGSAMLLLPGIGEAYVAPRIRLLFALLLSLLIAPLLQDSLPGLPASPIRLLVIIGSEIVCAGQRPDRVGWSPTGARVGGAISKSGGNASLAGVS